MYNSFQKPTPSINIEEVRDSKDFGTEFFSQAGGGKIYDGIGFKINNIELALQNTALIEKSEDRTMDVIKQGEELLYNKTNTPLMANHINK